jgi:4-hydroxybenzoate polyprenyltransferase
VINDVADRDIDPHVARTRDRPVAAGRVTPAEALSLFVGLCGVAFALVVQLNLLTVLLAVPAVVLAATYPYAKRFHSLPQAHLGLAFAWGIPMAYAAVTGAVDLELCTLLMLATVLWAVVYDTFYAMVDRDDDERIGVRSSAILFGSHDRLVTGLLQIMVLAVLALAGWAAGRGAWFVLGLVAGAATFAYQQWLVRDRDRDACFRAFLNNHYFGAAVFLGLFLDYG